MADENVEQEVTETVDRGDDINAEAIEQAEVTEEEAKVAEGKEEPEVEAKAEEEEPKAEAKEPMLPKRRYDAQTRARKAAEERVAELEEKLSTESGEATSPASAADFDTQMLALDKEIEAARQDGDTDKVFDLMTQQRKAQTEFFTNALQQTAESTSAEAQNAMKLDHLITNLEEAYDVLNPDSETFDEDLVLEINELKDAYEGTGYSPADALSKAVDLIMPVRVATNPADVVDLAEHRKSTDVKKNVDTAKRSPTDLAEAGKDSNAMGMKDGVDPTRLTEKEFEELPEEAMRRLRGDFL